MINDFKNISKGKNLSSLDIIKSLIKEEIPYFIKAYPTLYSKNEDDITINFVSLMNNRTRALEKIRDVSFTREYPQKGAHRVDIGVELGANVLVYTIEAKILPTPQSKKRDEHEYVYTKEDTKGSGGIERFKELKHGLNEEGKALVESGMLAYIKAEDFPDWEQKVNKWIDDINWGTSEHLQKMKNFTKAMGLLESRHKRIDGTDIKLTHFWIKIPE